MSYVAKALGTGVCVCFVLAGCSQPRPVEELARAKALVDQADASNVHRFASAELEQARGNLREAEKAAADDENEVARRRANQAAADAELASARAQSRQVQAAASEMQRSLDTLRQEATRGIPSIEPKP